MSQCFLRDSKVCSTLSSELTSQGRTIDDVGKSALYLLSDLSSGVTGEIHHVDSGYHVVGMKAVDAPDISVVGNSHD